MLTVIHRPWPTFATKSALFGPAEAAGRCPFSRVDRKSSADGENDANDPEPTISRFLDFGLVTGQREFQDQL
jgi:hypothetical protein